MSVIIPNASGYGGLLNTPLSRPGYHDKFMDRVYERDYLREITNSQIAERITSETPMIQLMRKPSMGPWRTYTGNQAMVPSQVTTTGLCISICGAIYNALKIDDLDVHWNKTLWPAFEEAFLEDGYEKFVSHQRSWVFNNMILSVDKANQGINAGKYKAWNLGVRGTPRVITPANLAAELSKFAQIFMENLTWKEGQMFIVLPPVFRSFLVQSRLADASFSGFNQSIIIDGLWEHPILGFKIITSPSVPSFIDASGNLCFHILCGHSDAFAYASDIIRGRLVQDVQTFSTQYQMLAVWGGEMIYPEKMAMGIWHFDLTAMNS